MHDLQVELGVKTMSDLVRKETHGIFNTKNPKEEQIWDYKAWFDDDLYIIEELPLKIIMHCRLSSEKKERFTSKYSALGYKIDLYFHNYKIAIKVDEKGHKDRDINHEMERQKAIETKIDCEWKTH